MVLSSLFAREYPPLADSDQISVSFLVKPSCRLALLLSVVPSRDLYRPALAVAVILVRSDSSQVRPGVTLVYL